jgi:hypothetical protein
MQKVAYNRTPTLIEQQIVDLYLSLHSPKYITKTLGVSSSTVHKILRRNSVPSHIKTIQAGQLTEKRCSSCLEKKQINAFPTSSQRKFSTHDSICFDCKRIKTKEYYQKNIIARRDYNRKWARNQRLTNIQYKVAQNLRRRIREVVKANSCFKASKTMELVGCNLFSLLNYLQTKFLPGMTWENYGEWHIDHIKPCSSFDLTNLKEQFECFHYSNLQPLWAKDNLMKQDKVN